MLQVLTTLRRVSPGGDTKSASDSSRSEIVKNRCEAAPLAKDTARRRHSVPVRNSHLRAPSGGTLSRDIEVPHLTPTPWELERRQKGSVRRRTQVAREFPARIFKLLPREVYDCIVEKVAQLHLGYDQSCPACSLSDLYNLSLTSRSWDRATSFQLYRKVWVLGHDHRSVSTLKILGTSRIKLLRRTLRERKALAKLVQELHMPDFQALYNSASIEREEIVHLVASLVMACPNLERLVGFHTPYTHSFDRLSYALSTRPCLQEKVWFFTDGDMGCEEPEEDDPAPRYYHAACDPTERFLELNSHNPQLTTVLLHQETSISTPTDLSFRAIIGALRQMPLLRHLSISGFPATSFSNFTLNALPADLRSLRLERLPGVTDRGLLRFSNSSAAITLRSITLINLEISDLSIIGNFLRPHLAQLQRFSLAQHKAPSIPSGIPLPVLQSATLEYIHWELRIEAGPAPSLAPPVASENATPFPFTNDEPIYCLATSLLAGNIRKGFFPSLQRIRAPHDPQGVLQAVCKPLGTALLPPDSALVNGLAHLIQPPLPNLIYPHPSSPDSQDHDGTSICSMKAFLDSAPPPYYMRADSAAPSPTPPSFDEEEDAKSNSSGESITSLGRINFSQLPLLTSLTPTRSRFAAQARVLSARKKSLARIDVHDDTGSLIHSKRINAYLGDARSRVVYDLKPDRNLVAEELDGDEGVDNQWITGIGDVMGEWEVGGRKSWGGCGHRVKGRVGRNSVGVGDVF